MTSGSPINDPSALSGVLTGVSFVGGLATGLSLANAPFPQPGTDVKDIQTFFQGSSGAERINVAGQLLSAASLAVFSRSVFIGRSQRIQDAQGRCHRRWSSRQHLAGRLRDSRRRTHIGTRS